MTTTFDFDQAFATLTGFPPFPWQRRLFDQYLSKGALPAGVDIPTGLGKTAVMAIWLLARAKQGLLEQKQNDSADQIEHQALPRRLVYVVDRRAVVDQATSFAEEIRNRLCSRHELEPVHRGLGLGDGQKLPISTLRGRHVDNREWMEDPSAAAIIVGTVDMIGSRLLFEGYGVSRKMRPFAAGLLGCDTLVMLDEAHLVPPFKKLLKDIERGSNSDVFGPQAETDRKVVPPFRMLPLSATGREDRASSNSSVFQLQSEDYDNEIVSQRLLALKRLTIIESAELVSELAEQAWRLGSGSSPRRVLVYCNSREDAVKVKAEIDMQLKKHGGHSELLVGARRVREREDLAGWLRDKGFLGDTDGPPEHPVFLIATSAGEVGVDLDADHMVCDLVEWERMVQRLGRVNRRGNGDARIKVIAAPRTRKPSTPKKAEEWEKQWQERLARLRRPLDSLRHVVGTKDEWDASPNAILELKKRAESYLELRKAIEDATTSTPLRPGLTRALVDAWSLTSLGKYAGRPDDLQPWLRGWEENQRPQTTIIWRKYLPIRKDGIKAAKGDVEAFFEAAPPHVSEKLETETHRVFDWLMKRIEKVMRNHPQVGSAETSERRDIIAYILSPSRDLRDTVHGYSLIQGDAKEQRRAKENLKESLMGGILVVDACLGGLSNGLLDKGNNSLPRMVDDGQEWLPPEDDKPLIPFRVRSVMEEESHASDGDWRERYRFITKQSDEGEAQRFLIVEKWRHDAETEDDRSVGHLQELTEHHAWTECKARNLATALGLPNTYIDMLAIAGRLHDEGKRHRRWQQSVKAPCDGRIYAKTNKRMNTKLLEGYRHEFGSLRFVEKDNEFKTLSSDLRELMRHLIAAHHGWARPVISVKGCDEPPSILEERGQDVALRFMHLQRRWGPWALAWWEVLLRAADQQASRDNDERGNPLDRRAKEGI